MNVVCYGDSNTYGYDPRSYFGDRYDADCRWVDILAVRTGWNIVNAGMNGREIPRRAISVAEDIDLLIIMLGTNDLLQGRSVENVTEQMEAFLSGLMVQKDKIRLVAPPPMRLGEWVTEQKLIDASEQLAETFRELAEQLGVRFINAGKWNIPMAYDGVHFTEEGHKRFAIGLSEELIK